jgi:hypothetical protein
MPHCPGGHLQDLIEKKSEKDKSIPLAHVYMTTHFHGLVHTLQ